MRSLLSLLVLVAACETTPPLTNDTSLNCPSPDGLPFRLPTSGFQRSVNHTIAADNPRIKDQASDTIGRPDGLTASIYLSDSAPPNTTPIDYHGVKSRAPANNGLSNMPLAGENISVWAYTGGVWLEIGHTVTDENGVYDVPRAGYVAANGQPVYALLNGDSTCTEHFQYLFPAGTKVVVSDIDGTLTLDDNELLMQLGNGDYVPKMMGAADKLTQTWAMKGYPVIYLTARMHTMRAETRAWLGGLAFAPGPVITTNSTGTADVYKTVWMKRMIQNFGWDVVAAYGNADTDITAYNNAGVLKERTFIVGPLAGTQSTVAIQNNDFSQHIDAYVKAQPDLPH